MSYVYAILISLFCLFGLSNCQKKCDFSEIEGEVTIHLVDTFELLGLGCQIDEGSVVIDPIPYITYANIKSYDSDDHIFLLDAIVIDKIKEEEYLIHKKAFAVLANDELIYTAYFWSAYSSLSCDWYTADPLMVEYDNGLKVKMGYPGDRPELFSQDKRNDERILCIFERDGKLK